MKNIRLILAFAIVAGLAAISPPAISYYYGDTSPISAEIFLTADLTAK